MALVEALVSIYYNDKAYRNADTTITWMSLMTSAFVASAVALILFCLLFHPERRRRQQQSPQQSLNRARTFSNLDTSEHSFYVNNTHRSRSFSWDLFSSWNQSRRLLGNNNAGDNVDKNEDRNRTFSWDALASSWRTPRERGASMDGGITPMRQAPSDAYHFSHHSYHGPGVQHLSYKTWTPPPTWAETARRVLPGNVPTLERTLKLHLSSAESTFSIALPVGVESGNNNNNNNNHNKKNGNDTDEEFSMPTDIMAVHPHTPAVSGVLDIYVKESPRSEWMEHTFVSAKSAAQFQLDLQAIQTLGGHIYNMYQALEIVHRGSMAYAGVENVLHDAKEAVGRPGSSFTGIAWDDVMRALGIHFPLIKWRLEQVWWAEMSGMVRPSENSGSDDFMGLVEEYQKKRLLLGLVDFFRLFVPQLPNGAVPEMKPTSDRFERLLRWRKRVARASLLVQGYVNAKVIANRGWKIDLPIPDSYLTKRLAYDESMDNMIRDSSSENEIYEPTVTRDFHCIVRGKKSEKDLTEVLVRSKGQAFMLVDIHLFCCVEANAGSAYDFTTDPVESLPTLRGMIKENPSLDFFVLTLRIQDDLAAVYVFVRSLPYGIDSAFDTAWNNFRDGDSSFRSQKLECIFSISIPPRGMSIFSRIFWKVMSTMLACAHGSSSISQDFASKSDNCSLGSCRLSLFGGLRHFGGSLQSNSGLPKNYLASTVLCKSNMGFAKFLLLPNTTFGGVIRTGSSTTQGESFRRHIAKLIFQRQEIVTFTIKLGGIHDSEIPERALATVRHVRLSPALKPVIFNPSMLYLTDERRSTSLVGWQGLLSGQFLGDGVSSITSIVSPHGPRPLAAVIATADPIEKGVNQIIEILEDVRIPTREHSNGAKVEGVGGLSIASNFHFPPSAENALRSRSDLRQVPVLERVSRGDIRRFYIASGLNVKTAAVRVVDTLAWRGLTFPIDTRCCRLELHNGQFFQQGRDLSGHPIFYFRAMLKGAWRGDEDAVVSCVLHRLEMGLERLASTNPHVRCTVIVILGRPVETSSKHRNDNFGYSDNAESSIAPDIQGDTNNVSEMHLNDQTSSNCRISQSEPLQVHVSMRLLHRLIDLLLYHYPERLYRALIVTKNSSRLGLSRGAPYFARHLKGHGVRDRVKIIRNYKDLTAFVHPNELVEIAGGAASIAQEAFCC